MRLLHVLAAFAFVAGYVATKVLTEMARRNPDLGFRRSAVAFSTRFDRMLNAPGAMAVGISGALATWALGYSFLAAWIVAAIVLWIALALLGILFWSRVGRGVEQALERGDRTRVDLFFLSPRNIAISRVENLIVLVIIALMVLRPTF